MGPTTPIPQSQANVAGHSLSSLHSSIMVLCLCLSVFGTGSVVMAASTQSQIPLFEESTGPTPPPVAQAQIGTPGAQAMGAAATCHDPQSNSLGCHEPSSY